MVSKRLSKSIRACVVAALFAMPALAWSVDHVVNVGQGGNVFVPSTVNATVGDFTWASPVTAKVGDVITWTNSDTAPHRVGLDDGSCEMSGNIAGSGGKASLVFTVAGTYPFHCTIHSSMKGTITITQ